MSGIVDEDEHVWGLFGQVFPVHTDPGVVNVFGGVFPTGCLNDGLRSAEPARGENAFPGGVEHEGVGHGFGLLGCGERAQAILLVLDHGRGGILVAGELAHVGDVFFHGLPRVDHTAFLTTCLAA